MIREPHTHGPDRDERPDLRALPLDLLAGLVEGLGERPFRARQLYRWLQQKGAASLDEMTDVSRPLREALGRRARLTTLERAGEQRSQDGTIKWTWRTEDGKLIESVYLPEPERKTLCLSTQVGCAVGCTFCLTATMGLARNLTAGGDRRPGAARQPAADRAGGGDRDPGRSRTWCSWAWASRSPTTGTSSWRWSCSSPTTGPTSPTVT